MFKKPNTPETQNVSAAPTLSSSKFNFMKLLGTPHLVAAILCIAAFILLIIYGIYPQELSVLYFQMACGATGFMCVLLGLEWLLFSSKQRRGIRNALIFDIIVSIMLAITLIITAQLFAATYLGNTILGSDLDMWDEKVLSCFGFCYYFAIVAAIILFLSEFPLGFIIYKMYKEDAQHGHR